MVSKPAVPYQAIAAIAFYTAAAGVCDGIIDEMGNQLRGDAVA